MKFIFRILLIATVTYFTSMYLPWWTIVVVSALVAYALHGSTISAFISGFLGGGIVWLLVSWMRDLETKSIISNKVVQLFPFEDPIFLIIASGIVGGLAAGFGAATGNSFRQLFIRKKKASIYS